MVIHTLSSATLAVERMTARVNERIPFDDRKQGEVTNLWELIQAAYEEERVRALGPSL